MLLLKLQYRSQITLTLLPILFEMKRILFRVSDLHSTFQLQQLDNLLRNQHNKFSHIFST
jgi:hypothetical protein